MLSGRSDLPDFANPPVIEVALSFQFERLGSLHASHLGLLWSRFRDRFPKTEDHPPREPIIEQFGVFSPPGVRVQIETVMPVPRAWFLNEAGTELIQVQQDCFVHNWRKIGVPAEIYPRYESIRQTFSNELGVFLRFVEEEGIGKVIPTQCEITYVNHLVAGEGWDALGEVECVLAPWSGKYSEPFLPMPEEIRTGIRYLIPGAQNEPIGRLHVDLVPAVDLKTQRRVFVLTLTARGRPTDEGIDGVLRFLDKGREWIVRGFAAITTSNMHRVWGRLDAR
ncbi:MAG: TIGR04255 family protein [Gemmatimonadales bacterium]|nr:TIGR04255 family protein [Gemmatimonadales bacterium]